MYYFKIRVTRDHLHITIYLTMGKTDCVRSPSSMIIKINIILYTFENGINSSLQGCWHQGAVKYPFTAPWLPIMYLAYVSLQYACSTTRNSSKTFVAGVYCLHSSRYVDTRLVVQIPNVYEYHPPAPPPPRQKRKEKKKKTC